MSNYALVTCINGNFKVDGEYQSINSATVGFHGKCQALWNAPDVESASVAIANKEMQIVKTEAIEKEVAGAEE